LNNDYKSLSKSRSKTRKRQTIRPFAPTQITNQANQAQNRRKSRINYDRNRNRNRNRNQNNTQSQNNIAKPDNDKYFRQMFYCKRICDKLKTQEAYEILSTISSLTEDSPFYLLTLDSILMKLKNNSYESIYNFAWDMTDYFNTLKNQIPKDSDNFTKFKELNQVYEKEFQILDTEIYELDKFKIQTKALAECNKGNRRRSSVSMIGNTSINRSASKINKNNNKNKEINKENYRPLSFEEKKELKNKLMRLTTEGIKEVIKIVGGNINPNKQYELDLENMSSIKLREIQKFVSSFNKKDDLIDVLKNNVNT